MLFTQLQVNSLELIPSLHNTNSTGPDNSDSHSNNKPLLQYSDGVNTTFTIIKGIIYSVIIMSALFGNALVFIAFLRFTRLRRVRTNIFLISLALADFIVALLVMPFNAIMSLSNHKWIFGKLFCDIYNATDVLFSTASILHLCCISTDRYIAIIHPLNYEIKMSKKRISILLCLTWTLSFFISFIPILLGWHKPFAKLPQFMTPPPSHGMKQEYAGSTNDVVDDPFTCDFNVNPYYATISSSISFWIPSVIMVVVYIRIFIEARRQERKIARLQINYHQFDNNDNNNNNNIKQPQTPSSIKPLNFLNKKCRSTDKLCTNYTAVSKRLTNSSFCSNNNNNNHSSSTPCIQITDERYKAQIKIKHESKAARTLGVVMGAFLLCWLPFFLWYTITNLCKCPYPSVLQEILFWIGYLNSTINPIIYAFYNRTFRNAFIKIIECQKPTTSSDDPQQQMDSYRSPVTRRNKMDALADGRYASVRIEDSNRSTNVPYFTENKSIDYEDNI
ncbi:unnamed protein product [Trichobilharzia szidati]|nr:unnamed protein product [Trichobilharzia szidati]